MSQMPALPLWIDAWVADTAHLTRAERGLYHDLLVLMWKTPGCRVPNDTAWIGRKLRCSEEEVVMLQSIIAEFCSSTGNWVVQKRLQKEFDYVSSKSKKQSGRAKSRWDKEKAACHGNAPTPTPTPTPTQKLEGVSKDTPTGGPSVQGELLAEKTVLVDVTTAQAAVDAYNAMAVKVGLPTTKLLTEKRRKAIAQRVKECGGLEGWNELMLRVAASKTLTGKKIDWRANLDFIIRPSSFIKIIEGNYDDKPAPQHHKPNGGYSAQDALRGLYSGG